MSLKKIPLLLSAALIAGLAAGCTQSAPPSETPAPPTETPDAYGAAPVAEHASYGDYGVVLGVTEQEDSVYIVSEGRFGYHMDEDPAMTVGVTIDSTGTIVSVVNVANRNQTEGFAEQITDDYLAEAYAGLPALPTMEVDAVSGATTTSSAVLYAVQAAANYAQQVYGYVADTHQEDREELNQCFPADYTDVQSSAEIDEKKIGTVLYAAEGTTESGQNVVAMKVKSAVWLSYGGSANTGWDAAEPGPFTMIIVVDKDTNQVVSWTMVKDGTTAPEYFTVPDERIDTYKSVTIDSPEVFDTFTDGLVYDLDVTQETSADGYDVITGTSIVYTGATNNGTFSSQLVRLCFMAAARFYCGI